MSDPVVPVADPAPAANPAPVDATLITAPTPADPNAADPNAADPNEGKTPEEVEAEAKAKAEAEANAGKTPEEIEAEAKAKAEEEAKAAGAPDEYTAFTMPEGIELDVELTDEFKAAAKELNLTQDGAQKLVNLAAAMRQRDVEAVISTRAEWVEQSKADPEIGGDKLDANLAVAKRAIDAFGSPRFIQLLNETGLGNHPEVIRTFAKAGASVSEDKVVAGGDPTSTPHRTLAKRLYTPNKE